jgi:hypothetical protein
MALGLAKANLTGWADNAPMKVLNLGCAQQHRFEGWFASDDDFVSQQTRGLVACPLCGDIAVTRLPSAPRLNVSRPTQAAEPGVQLQERQTHWMNAVKRLIERTEDVGERFPEEARRIHYGEVAQRGIRGRATREDTEALRDEGIEVMAIAVPEALKGSVQ